MPGVFRRILRRISGGRFGSDADAFEQAAREAYRSVEQVEPQAPGPGPSTRPDAPIEPIGPIEPVRAVEPDAPTEPVRAVDEGPVVSAGVLSTETTRAAPVPAIEPTSAAISAVPDPDPRLPTLSGADPARDDQGDGATPEPEAPVRRQAGDTAPEHLLRTPQTAAHVADDFLDDLVRRVEGDR